MSLKNQSFIGIDGCKAGWVVAILKAMQLEVMILDQIEQIEQFTNQLF